MKFVNGMIVENVGAPSWGPGKIVHVSGDNLHIIFPKRIWHIVSPYEKAAFRDAMGEGAAVQSFFTTLLKVFGTKPLTSEVFEEFAEAVTSLPAPEGRVATWPVATIFLYLAEPARFMFLKPEVTKAAADSLGFDLRYSATLNWNTYDALQRMGALYLDLLQSLGPAISSMFSHLFGSHVAATTACRPKTRAGKRSTV